MRMYTVYHVKSLIFFSMLMNSSIKDLLLQKDAHTHCCEHVRYACLDMHEFNSRNRQVELGEEKGFRGTTETAANTSLFINEHMY